MTRIEEERLVFEFGEQWNAFKFDGHHDYRQGIEKVDETKAVDFLGIFNEAELYFVEIKDFRGSRIENKDRLSSGQLAIEVAQKVRDSIACIVGAFHNSSDREHWQPYIRLLCTTKSRIKVAVWLEEDAPSLHHQSRQKARASIKTKVFQQKLSWLTKRVLVYGKNKRDLPDVLVSNLPQT